jgi:hypothetical protein
MKPLLLLLALCPADAPQATDDRAERAVELATITPAEARRLDGRRARFVVQLNSLPDCRGWYTACDVVAPIGLHASVHFVGERGWDGIVQATLHVIEHRAWVAPDGTRIESFSEYWLADAVR